MPPPELLNLVSKLQLAGRSMVPVPDYWGSTRILLNCKTPCNGVVNMNVKISDLVTLLG